MNIQFFYLIQSLFIIIYTTGVGILSSILGLGGGSMTTPILIAIGLPPAIAIGTVLVMISATAISSTIGYIPQKQIHYRYGFLVALPEIIGGLLGSFQSSIIEPSIFKIIFVVCLTPLAIRMILNTRDPSKRSEANKSDIESPGYPNQRLLLIFFGFLGGVLSGLLGIGGGIVMVPVLLHIGRLEMHRVAATSTFIMIFTSLAGLSIKILFNQIYFDIAIYLVIGAIIGTQTGCRISPNIDQNLLQKLFGIVMLGTLVYIFLTSGVIV